MKKMLFLFVAFSLLFSNSAFAQDLPKKLMSEIGKAMTDGAALYKAYLEGPVTGKNIEKEKNKIDDFCAFKYNAYLANGSVYFIAEHPTSGGIVFGKHFKITGNNITKSTITCFASPEQPPENAVASYTTHLLSNTPTEFHVFASLQHKKPIYVVTKIGIWKVEGEKILFAEKWKENS